jgi:hypothetical protein
MSSSTAIRWLALLGLGGSVVFVAAVVALHGLQPQLSPMNDAVSYYVHGAYGWLTTVGLIALGIGSLALTFAVAGWARGRGGNIGVAALAVWGVGGLAAGIFSADPPGNWDQPPSLSGAVHGLAAMIAIASFPLAAVLLTRNLSRDHRWQRFRGPLLALAAAVALSFIAFMGSLLPVFVSPGPPIWLGLTERVMLAVYVAWLAAVAVGLLRSSQSSSGQAA